MNKVKKQQILLITIAIKQLQKLLRQLKSEVHKT